MKKTVHMHDPWLGWMIRQLDENVVNCIKRHCFIGTVRLKQ